MTGTLSSCTIELNYRATLRGVVLPYNHANDSLGRRVLNLIPDPQQELLDAAHGDKDTDARVAVTSAEPFISGTFEYGLGRLAVNRKAHAHFVPVQPSGLCQC